MKGFPNLLVDVKVTKNVKRQNHRINANNFFATFQNN
jgi:hypothetical protein